MEGRKEKETHQKRRASRMTMTMRKRQSAPSTPTPTINPCRVGLVTVGLGNNDCEGETDTVGCGKLEEGESVSGAVEKIE